VTSPAEVCIRKFLDTPPGRITTEQAHELVRELVNSEGLAAIIQDLLSSGKEVDRILGAYCLLEAHGLTPDVRELAVADPSPRVRAEVVRWLFLRGDFAGMDMLLDRTAPSLAATEATNMVSLLANEPYANVPVAMHRLRLGTGLPRYAALLMERSENVAAAAVSLLVQPQLAANAKKRLLDALRVADPPGRTEALTQLIQTEKSLAVRTLAAADLAARVSETNVQQVSFLRESLPDPVQGLEPVDLRFREKIRSDILGLEDEIGRSLASGEPSPARLQVLIGSYLQAVQLVGRGGMETQALAGVLEKAKAKRVILSDAVIAECEYLIHKSRAGLGNTGIPNQQ
jgi:hypothetical protein